MSHSTYIINILKRTAYDSPAVLEKSLKNLKANIYFTNVYNCKYRICCFCDSDFINTAAHK